MTSTYRRKRGSDIWHFCSNCGNWPLVDYDECLSEPTNGARCGECQTKKQDEECE